MASLLKDKEVTSSRLGSCMPYIGSGVLCLPFYVLVVECLIVYDCVWVRSPDTSTQYAVCNCSFVVRFPMATSACSVVLASTLDGCTTEFLRSWVFRLIYCLFWRKFPAPIDHHGNWQQYNKATVANGILQIGKADKIRPPDIRSRQNVAISSHRPTPPRFIGVLQIPVAS